MPPAPCAWEPWSTPSVIYPSDKPSSAGLLAWWTTTTRWMSWSRQAEVRPMHWIGGGRGKRDQEIISSVPTELEGFLFGEVIPTNLTFSGMFCRQQKETTVINKLLCINGEKYNPSPWGCVQRPPPGCHGILNPTLTLFVLCWRVTKLNLQMSNRSPDAAQWACIWSPAPKH